VVGEDKIKLDFKESVYGVVEWIERVPEDVSWRAPVDSTMAFYKLLKIS
jgi:hypothetical protein